MILGQHVMVGAAGTVGHRSGAILCAGNGIRVRLFGRGVVGGTDPRVYADALKNGQLNCIPSDHSPRFAPVIHPKLKTGLQTMTTAVMAWFE